MTWLVALLLAVVRDPHVQRAFRVFLLAVLSAAAAALGLTALLPLAAPLSGS